MVLDNLEPKRVFEIFEEISQIPHGSYNTQKIADYIESFGKRLNLNTIRDKYNNIIIKKPKTADSASDTPVIIQGHMDMVCAKDEKCDINLETDALRLDCDGEYVFAKGTTLGADDGIALAYALAILEADDIAHPPIECVFTVDEEVGMLGANALDMSNLQGKYLLNIDSEVEGEFCVSCAGGATVKAIMPIKKTDNDYQSTVKIEISGLLGGHSGVEIDKGRANANILMGELLKEISQYTAFDIVSMDGGQKDNAIPKSACTVISTPDVEVIKRVAKNKEEEFSTRYKHTGDNIKISVSEVSKKQGYKSEITRLLSAVTDGVREMSQYIDNLVETSSNLGVIRTNNDSITVTFSVRSSVNEKKTELINEITGLSKECGCDVEVSGEYPPWEYSRNSRLQELCKRVYKEQYGKEPEIMAIHAGLECGIFASKISGLQCISFGPNLLDIHTTNERMEIKSVERVFEFLKAILKEI
ncbi:MAG: aminoacyl-histidine dipeptidase [Clostridia bacterium]|nr:aminoacyl-histidine dipeptidase [Clostridia bacterium]